MLATQAAGPIHAAEPMLSGTYPGTITCDQAPAGPAQPSFSGPITFKVDNNTLTWTRETPAMREVVSGPIVDGKVALDGYGGSVSAATRQAFWDWRLAAQLVVVNGEVTGTAQLRSKDGRIVQQQCTVASLSLSTPPKAETSAPSQPKAQEPVAATGVALPNTQAAGSTLPAPPSAVPNASSTDEKRAAGLDAEVRRREEALNRREQSVTRRERALAQQQPKALLAPPAAPAKQQTAPVAPPIPSNKTPAAAVQGDI